MCYEILQQGIVCLASALPVDERWVATVDSGIKMQESRGLKKKKALRDKELTHTPSLACSAFLIIKENNSIQRFVLNFSETLIHCKHNLLVV